METTSNPPTIFFCTGVYKVILQSRKVLFNVGRLLFKPLPQGPLRLCVYYHQFPLHTYLLFMIHLLCQNCSVCVTLCCATFVWLIHLRYTPLKVIFLLFNAVTRAGRRDCRPLRRTKCYMVQCSVQWSPGPPRDAVRSSQSRIMFLASLHMCTFFGSL